MTDIKKHNDKINKARKMFKMTLVGGFDIEEGRQKQIDSAKNLYENYIKNHGLEEYRDQIEGNTERRIKIKYQDEFALCAQVIASVNPFAQISYETGLIKVNLDSDDYAEVKCKFKHFKVLWRADLEMLKLAFNTKHQQWFAPDSYAMQKHAGSKGVNIYEQAKEQALQINEKLVGKEPPKTNISGATDKEKLLLYNLMRMQAILGHLANADYKPTR